MSFLAGPELEGRANGQPGGAKARAAIEAVFRELKLTPVGEDQYLQAIPDGANVLGLIEGHHPQKRHEVVVLGAHYDHLGLLDGKMYPGADDNASSVAIVLEWLRRQHNRGWKPDRSVLVAAFDAEEPPDFRTQDMGSQVFMNKPTVDRNRIQAMVCLDLMGGDLWKGYRSPLFVMGLETFASSPLESMGDLQAAVPDSVLHLRCKYQTLRNLPISIDHKRPHIHISSEYSRAAVEDSAEGQHTHAALESTLLLLLLLYYYYYYFIIIIIISY